MVMDRVGVCLSIGTILIICMILTILSIRMILTILIVRMILTILIVLKPNLDIRSRLLSGVGLLLRLG